MRSLYGYFMTSLGLFLGVYLIMTSMSSSNIVFRQQHGILVQGEFQVIQGEIRSGEGARPPVLGPPESALNLERNDVVRKSSTRDIHNWNVMATLPKKANCSNYRKLNMKETLEEVAIDKVIVVAAFIDKGYVDMAENFYLTSILPHGITNVMFFCIDESACQTAWDKCIPALLYVSHVADDQTGAFETEAFFAKSRLKLKLVQQILEWGFTVLLTDVDIWYFQNPLHHFHCDSDCDMLVQNDNLYLNTGFNYIRPTERSLEWYKYLVKATEEWQGPGDDQRIFNEKYHEFQKRRNNATKLQLQVLDIQRFPVALVYFEENQRFFPWDNPCEDCIIVHNNWLFGTATKVYRFKENFMWFIDNKGYYSDPDAKYLRYEHPVIFDKFNISRRWENRALQNALIIGNITKRIVILPQFTCENSTVYKCPLNSHYRVAAFDQHFGNTYRESTFLEHPLVPSHIKTSHSPLIRITDTSNIKASQLEANLNAVQYESVSNQSLYNFDLNYEISSGTLQQMLKEYSNYKVLHFHSLYDTQITFINTFVQADFSKKLRRGLVKSDYEQRITQG